MQALQTILALVLGISTIVVLSNRYRVPAFFSLLIASIIVAICLWLPAPVALQSMKTGFGQTLQSLGWLVIAGTGLGLFMEASGAARVLAQSILKLFGRKKASLSMAGTGYLVGLPVVCISCTASSHLTRVRPRRPLPSVRILENLPCWECSCPYLPFYSHTHGHEGPDKNGLCKQPKQTSHRKNYYLVRCRGSGRHFFQYFFRSC